MSSIIGGGLGAMRSILRGIGEGLTAASAAPTVDRYMRGQFAAGETPDGAAWPLTQDGRVALRGAAAAYEQSLSGNALILKIGGSGRKRYVVHHYGAGDQPVRQQLPAKLPMKLGNAIRLGLVQDFQSFVRRGRGKAKS